MTAMSKTHLSLYFLSLLILLFYVSSSSSSFILDDDPVVGLVACRPRQIQAFTQFKNEFDTRHCNHSDNSNGVQCDNSTGEITALRLNACLSGTLKPNSSLFKLQHLRYLNLSYNNFISSPLPSEFGHLNRLQVLSLFSNGFSGQVPSSFNNLSLLSYLKLEGNDLSGSFPHVWNLTKLSYLNLADNHFSGPVNTNSGLFELHHLRLIDLEINNFSSSIPSELGNLNRLETFSISNNGFFGQVPPTISNLTQLIQLFLDGNELSGSFPPVQNLTNLSRLDVESNNFSGTIPSSLLTMPSLSVLDIRENHLTGYFEVPNSSTSSRLEILRLGYNQFDAQILEPISKLINLTDIDLSFLNTSYPIDLGIFTPFHSLVYLILSGNKIHPASLSLDAYIPLTLRELRLRNCGIKEFPNILKTLRNLECIDLSMNLMKGKIPEWLWSLPRVGTLALSYNSFNGFQGSTEALVNSSVRVLLMAANKFDGALPDLPLSITIFSASFNKFTGEIPLSICDRTSLDGLGLAGNNFTGPVPQCLSNFVFVNLRNNNLEGSIPDVFRLGASLQILDVGFNQITGKLPRSLLNCSSLKFLSVDNNNIKDTFPFFLKPLSNLRVLILSSNKFYGPISLPHQGPLGFSKLRILLIADNKFSGSLSPTYFVDWKASSNKINEDGGLYMLHEEKSNGLFYSYITQMDLHFKGQHMERVKLLNSYRAIDFSGNLLEGNIPESIGLLEALIAIDLSNNAFTGHIPLSLANLKELESLDMSRNQLSGTIPNGLGSLSFLAYINVSHNQLKGEIPQGTQLTGQAKSSFEGNSGLCGLPLEKSCFDTSAPPAQHHKQEDDEEEEGEVLNWKGVAIGYGLGVLFGLVIAQVVVSYKPEWLAKIIGLNRRRNR